MTQHARTLGGRYELVGPLGSGGTGTVYAAKDLITTDTVAVKELNPLTSSARMRHRREVLALRVLQAPGVVKLFDEGVANGKPFIVMELVHGHPFPGKGRHTWEEIAPVTLALLETLARIHAIGIIHRDLKPANVLVDDNGRPTLLDFGLAWGDLIADLDATGPDAIVGTPRFQSPEQLTNQTLDPRTDLYSVGLMLWEALAPGRFPHPVDSYAALVTSRVWRDAPPLQFAAPEVPDRVCAIVDKLLARLPEARPRTANEVLQEIRDLSAEVKRAPFPLIGAERRVRHILDQIHDLRSVDIAGPSGSGRTRTLQEVADALARAGRRSAWTRRGARPYESIVDVVGALEAPDGDVAELSMIEASVARRLRETLAGGTVLLVDDAEECDHWSATLLRRLAGDGAIVSAWREGPPGAVALHPMDEGELRALFHGPERLLHLPEDGARALFERTGGSPGRVVSEVAAWVDNGLASWRDRKLLLDRTALDRLEGGVAVQVPATPSAIGTHLKRGLEHMLAWITFIWPHSTVEMLRGVLDRTPWEIELMVTELERLSVVRRMPDGRIQPRLAALALQEWSDAERRDAHATAARLLPAGASGRFAHLVGASDFTNAATEGLFVANQMVERGYLGRALGVMGHALHAARDAESPLLERELLVVGVKAALGENAAPPIAHVRYEIQRSLDPIRLGDLDALLAAAEMSFQPDWQARRQKIEALAPFQDHRLEAWRGALRMGVSAGDPSLAAEVLSEYTALAKAERSSFLLGKALGWEGLLLYRRGEYAEAANRQLAALPLKEGTADRLSTLLNAAAAWLECEDLLKAERCVEEAVELAREARLPVFEGRALGALRTIQYRKGMALEPDLEFVDALSIIGAPQFGTLALTTEAAVAWRRAELDLAATLAKRGHAGAKIAGNPAAAAVSLALALSSEGATDRSAWGEVFELVQAISSEAARVQALGLAARAVRLDPPMQKLLDASYTAWSKNRSPTARGAVLAPFEIAPYISKASGPTTGEE
jgi:hypothetical protein